MQSISTGKILIRFLQWHHPFQILCSISLGSFETPGFHRFTKGDGNRTEPEVFLIHSNHHLHTNGKPLPPHIVQQPGDDEGGEDFSDVEGETFKLSTSWKVSI